MTAVRKLKAQIDEWSAQAARWEAQMREAQGRLREEYARQLDQVKSRRDAMPSYSATITSLRPGPIRRAKVICVSNAPGFWKSCANMIPTNTIPTSGAAQWVPAPVMVAEPLVAESDPAA